MTRNLTRPHEVSRTPAGLFVPTFGPVDLTLVNPAAGQPVSLTLDPGQPVKPTPVNLTPLVSSTRPDPDPAEANLTEPRTDAPAGPVSGSTGQADPLTQEPAGGWWSRRRARRAAAKARRRAEKNRPATPAPQPELESTETAAAGDAKRPPVPVPWWLRLIFLAVMWTVTVVSTIFVAGGQVKAAENVGIKDERRYLVPVGLEAIAIALFLMGYIAGRHKISPWLFWIPGFGVGGFAVHNVYAHSGNPGQGMLIGGIAAASLILWWADLYLSLIIYRRKINFTPGGGIRFGRLWLDSPRLTFWAGRIARRWELTERQDAISHAEVMVALLNEAKAAHKDAKRRKRDAEATLRGQYGSTAESRAKAEQQLAEAREDLMPRALRLQVAWRTVQEAAGRPVAQLPSSATVDRIRLVRKQTPPPADPAPVEPPAAELDDVDEAVKQWQRDEERRLRRERQETARREQDLPDPADVPVSPAPAGSAKSPFVRHAKAIEMVTKTIENWKDRTDPVSFDEVVAAKPRNAKGELITGKGTLLDIRWLIEILSDRADQVPDKVYIKFGVSREGRAEA